jgi:hypothetical protein
MIMGGVSPWACAEDLREALVSAEVVACVEDYRSETLIVQRVATSTVGTYYLVVESDHLFPEDVDALEVIDREVRASWRMRCVESDYRRQPHPDFPWSDEFAIHVVHAQCPEVGRMKPPIDPGAIPNLKAVAYMKAGPYLRDKADVPHEDALPDLYGLRFLKVI